MLNCEKALLAMNDVPDAYIESARAMLGYRVGEQKRFSVRKRIIAFALAAALVLSLGIAAYAVYVHWSRGMERKLPATGRSSAPRKAACPIPPRLSARQPTV